MSYMIPGGWGRQKRIPRIFTPPIDRPKFGSTPVTAEQLRAYTVIVAADGSGDTEDIQSGLDAMPSTGGLIFVKAGLYELTSSITFPFGNISLVGEGYATHIKMAVAGAVNMIEIGNYSNILISDCQLDGNKGEVYGNHGVIVQTTAGNEATNLFFNHLWIHDCQNRGITLFGQQGTIDHCNINSCVLEDNFKGIHTYISGVVDANFNYISGSTTNGIEINHTEGAILIGNRSVSNTEDGIELSEARKCVVHANKCLSNGRQGIDLDYTGVNDTYHSIIGNQLEGNGCWGYYEGGGGEDCNLVLGNIILGNTDGGIWESGTKNEIAHNII